MEDLSPNQQQRWMSVYMVGRVGRIPAWRTLQNPPEQSWCFHWILASAYVLLLICLYAFSPHVWIPGRLGDENWNHARDVTQVFYVQLTTCSCPYSWTFVKTGWSEFACKHINIKLLSYSKSKSNCRICWSVTTLKTMSPNATIRT